MRYKSLLSDVAHIRLGVFHEVPQELVCPRGLHGKVGSCGPWTKTLLSHLTFSLVNMAIGLEAYAPRRDAHPNQRQGVDQREVTGKLRECNSQVHMWDRGTGGVDRAPLFQKISGNTGGVDDDNGLAKHVYTYQVAWEIMKREKEVVVAGVN